MRAAQDIAREQAETDERLPPIGDITLPAGEARKMTEELQKEMTRCAAFMRDAEGIRAMRKRLDELILHRVPLDKNDDELDARICLQDMMTAQMYILDAMLFDLEQPGTGILERTAEEQGADKRVLSLSGSCGLNVYGAPIGKGEEKTS